MKDVGAWFRSKASIRVDYALGGARTDETDLHVQARGEPGINNPDPLFFSDRKGVPIKRPYSHHKYFFFPRALGKVTARVLAE